MYEYIYIPKIVCGTRYHLNKSPFTFSSTALLNVIMSGIAGICFPKGVLKRNTRLSDLWD